MNFIKSIFIAVVCFLSVIKMEAQTAKHTEGQKTKTVYYYNFEGAKSLQEVNSLKAEVTALKGVTEFKTGFKPESNFAQIIVVVNEKTRTSEGDKLFQPTDLKKILEKKGYKNMQLTTQELPAE
jgi:copper chaperone CopZ